MQHKVLIVEDEVVIRNGLIKHVFWESLGVSEIEVAGNAEEALRICQEYHPDIVISDISMPGENGIELCKRLRKSFPEIEIIFVTGYDDKEYLKEAINLHAVRYVEKPVNRENISDAIKEAIQRRQKNIGHKLTSLHSLFFVSSSLPLYISENKVFCVGIVHLGQKDIAAKVKERLEECLAQWQQDHQISFIVEISDVVSVSFLLGGKEKFPAKRTIKKELISFMEKILNQGEKWFLAIGDQVKNVEDITDSWQSASNAGKALAYLGWNRIAFSEDIDENDRFEPDGTIVDRLSEAVFQKNEKAAKELLDNFLKTLLAKQIFLNGDIRYIYSAMYFAIRRAKQSMCLNDKSRIEDSDVDFLERAETFAEINQYLKDSLSDLFYDDGGSRKNTYVVKQVMDYIWMNYGEGSLSVKSLADYVYLTPTYLSNLFKKSTGMTIGQYLVDVRIESAKRLMRKEPQLKFYQVAPMVGYEDANYFAKIFKKKTGMTPSEYKESLTLR